MWSNTYIGLHAKYPVFFSGCNETWTFSRFSKIIQLSNFMKICPVGGELFYADGRTDEYEDMAMLIGAFRNIANAPKMVDWSSK